MTELLDIHSHILPGMDDGASSTKEALYMLRAAARQGVRGVIATPHYSRQYPNSCPGEIRRMCTELEALAGKYRIPVWIYPGQEIQYGEEIPEMLSRGELLTLAESRYVLTEFYPGSTYLAVQRAVQELTGRGYRPILAHVERISALHDVEKIQDLIKQGAYMQMNFRPAGGSWYDRTTRRCRKLLQEGVIHFMGTDMHNTKTRKPETECTLAWMERHLDHRYVQQIVRRNGERILDDEKIY